MKRICFPVTNRVHLARQKLLIDELKKFFDVDICELKKPEGEMAQQSVEYGTQFLKYIVGEKYDAVLVRADRFEMLVIAMLSFYLHIPLLHIEGGTITGKDVVDSRVRHAITKLSDIHFVTDEDARKNVIDLGEHPDSVFNVGSLDVSYVKQVKPKRIIDGDYVVFLHHAIPGEDTELAYRAVRAATHIKIITTQSNVDYKKSIFTEEYSPEDFINLLRFAKCFIGNSSAACKEASILGVPTCLTGRRQDGRVVGHNVIRAPHDFDEIKKVTTYQIAHGLYKPDMIYFQHNTEKKICRIIKNFYGLSEK